MLACKNDAQQNNSSINDIKQSKINEINFFDKKYFKGYEIAIDESNISDHPFFRFLECKDLGYFAVHFIPKNDYLNNFWKNEYFRNVDFNTYDFKRDNKKISSILKNNLEKYYIFSYYIPNQYLYSNGDCTEESVFLKDKTKAQLFQFDQISKKWKFIKEINNDVQLPPYLESYFFKNNFSQLNKATNIDWIGKYFTTVNENSKDWRDSQDITLTIKNDSIIFHADGYQIAQDYKLKITSTQANKIKLMYESSLTGDESAVLQKVKDFGTISFNGKKYTWSCPYIDKSFAKVKPTNYILKKKN